MIVDAVSCRVTQRAGTLTVDWDRIEVPFGQIDEVLPVHPWTVKTMSRGWLLPVHLAGQWRGFTSDKAGRRALDSALRKLPASICCEMLTAVLRAAESDDVIAGYRTLLGAAGRMSEREIAAGWRTHKAAVLGVLQTAASDCAGSGSFVLPVGSAVPSVRHGFWRQHELNALIEQITVPSEGRRADRLLAVRAEPGVPLYFDWSTASGDRWAPGSRCRRVAGVRDVAGHATLLGVEGISDRDVHVAHGTEEIASGKMTVKQMVARAEAWLGNEPVYLSEPGDVWWGCARPALNPKGVAFRVGVGVAGARPLQASAVGAISHHKLGMGVDTHGFWLRPGSPLSV